MTRELLTALDNERIRQDLTKSALSSIYTGRIDSSSWAEIMRRGSCTVSNLLKVCDALDVEIILVNKRGVNIF